MTKAQHTPGLGYEQEREVIRAYYLTEGQFYALPVAAQTSLHAAMGKNDSLVDASPELLAYAGCEEARRLSLLPTHDGGTGNGHSYMETFTKHGFGKNGRESVFGFLDRLRTAAIAKATGKTA